MWFWRLLVVVCWCEAALSARILGVFPTSSISHQVVFRELTLELARRGHELVVLTTDPAHLHPNITEIDAHDVSYPVWWEQFMGKLMEAERSGRRSMLNMFKMYMEYQLTVFDRQMSLSDVQHLLRYDSDHFDLIIVESLFRPAFAFRHKFKAPLIAATSMAAMIYTYDAIGVPSHPLLYHDFMSTKIANLSLLDKIDAVIFHLSKYYHDVFFVRRFDELIRKYFGEDTPCITELEAQTDMLFLNVNPIWDGIRPTPPNVLYMWGTHLKPAKPLPADLKSFLDNSTRGVVYMSLGSNVKSTELSEDRQRVFLEAFRRLPYDVLWKWEAEELPGRPDNVYISKWLPQADLLRHPNVKAFITQGGLQSTDEALQAGVPLVGVPIFADQESNVAKYEKHGVGVQLDIRTMTADKLEDAVNTVIYNEKYREAVRRMSRLLADGADGGPGVSRAVRWTEYVLRHGGAAHLRSPAAGISFSEYFMLDVVAVLGLAAALAALVLVAATHFLYRRLTTFRLIYKIKIHDD